MGGKRKNQTPHGARYGRLTVVGIPYAKNPGRYYVTCRCDCGAEVDVREDCLKSGNTKSCGCFQIDTVKANAKHGMWKTRTYGIWAGMKGRGKGVGNKKHIYSGKGVRVCDKWMRFENFYADMGDAPPGCSIDRIDGDGDYTPENCRWATPKEQANNMASNRVVEYKGEKKTAAQWAEALGIKPNTLIYRLRRGWEVSRAIEQPVQRKMRGT